MPDEKPEAAKTETEAEAEAEAPTAATPPSDASPSTAPEAQPDAQPDAAASDVPAEGAKVRKRRKKKKPVEESTRREPLGPDGRERPAFLLDFPEDPELERVIRAFELGNYALVRKEAPALAERTSDPKIRAAAEQLARRIEPDPLVKLVLGLSVLLLVVITFWAYKTHGG